MGARAQQAIINHKIYKDRQCPKSFSVDQLVASKAVINLVKPILRPLR
jgi:hypothetical protein